MSNKIKIIIIVIILSGLLAVFIPSYSKLQSLKNVNQDLTEQIENLKIENTQLTRKIRNLTEDPLYIENVARKKMGISKKGELIYKIVEGEEPEVREPGNVLARRIHTRSQRAVGRLTPPASTIEQVSRRIPQTNFCSYIWQ